MKPTRRSIIAALLLFTLAACATTDAGITIEDAWVRPSPAGILEGVNTGAFMVIRNQGDQADRLIGADCPAARVVEIHETTMVTDVMSMRPVAAVEVPAGGEVQLKPGSYHLMLIDLQQILASGDEIEITLIFERAGRVTFKAVVRE